MTRVLLFHHALGLTAGVRSFADRLRAAGHDVDTPDLFDRRTFDRIEDGVAFAEEIGFGEIIERGVRAADRRPGPAVYAGFSLGVLPAQKLAQTRPDAVGAVLIHSFVPVGEFGSAWPDGVPIQVHAMEHDPFFVDDGDLEAARALVETTDHATLTLYPGNAHLFADDSFSEYDAGATDRLIGDVLDLLAAAAPADDA